jgi:CHAD domain-containing protein
VKTRELIGERTPSVHEIADAVGGEFAVAPSERSESEVVYYDTFDALLRGRGLALVHEHGRLSLQDRLTAAEVQEQPRAEVPSGPLLGIALEPSRLRDALVAIVQERALLPLVHLHERTDALRVLDSLEKTVARIGVVTPELVSNAGLRTPLRARVRLSSVRGYDNELERTAALLADSLALSAPDLSLFDEALIAAGTSLEGASTKIEVAMNPKDRADAAAVRVLRRLLEVMDDNLPGTLADTDSEFLHDYRVAVRRTRSVQRQLACVFEPGQLATTRSEFRWLQLATGDARDLDVYVLGFDSMRELLPESIREDIEPLRTVLRGRRLAARREMAHALRTDRAKALRADWEDLLGSLVESSAADRPCAERPIGEVSSQRIRRVYGGMLRMGRAIEASSPPEDFHELRKKGKELRYLLELFGAPLHDEAVVRPMVKTLKGLQDVLGRHQDREVQVTKLRTLADEVSVLPGGTAALMAMGVLIERLYEDAMKARGEFAESFATFSSAEQRRLVKETFR